MDLEKNVEGLIKSERKYRKKILIIFAIFFGIVYLLNNLSLYLRDISAILLVAAFYVVDILFDIDFKLRHYFFVFFIAVSGLLLSPFYFIYPNYDKILHFVQPLMLSSIVFHIARNLKIKLRWKLTLTFFIVSGIIGIHEVVEYSLDYFFDMKLQGVFLRGLQGLKKFILIQSRIDDTMSDMIFGYLGSLFYVAYSILKHRKD